MKFQTIIFTVLLIPFYSTFLRGQNLRPIMVDDLYCFDSLQVRYVAKEIHQSPIKDSIIQEQKGKIESLEEITEIQDDVISKKDTLISNKDVEIKNIQDEKKAENQKCEIEKTNIRKGKKPLIWIAFGEFVLLVFCILAK